MERLSVGLVKNGREFPSAMGQSHVHCLYPPIYENGTKSWGQLAQLEKERQPLRVSLYPQGISYDIS